MISGGQCVMTPGIVMMQLLSADSWDMHTLEVSEDCWIVSLVLSHPKMFTECRV